MPPTTMCRGVALSPTALVRSCFDVRFLKFVFRSSFLNGTLHHYLILSSFSNLGFRSFFWSCFFEVIFSKFVSRSRFLGSLFFKVYFSKFGFLIFFFKVRFSKFVFWSWVFEDGFTKFVVCSSFFEVRFCWFFEIRFSKLIF